MALRAEEKSTVSNVNSPANRPCSLTSCFVYLRTHNTVLRSARGTKTLLSEVPSTLRQSLQVGNIDFDACSPEAHRLIHVYSHGDTGVGRFDSIRLKTKSHVPPPPCTWNQQLLTGSLKIYFSIPSRIGMVFASTAPASPIS